MPPCDPGTSSRPLPATGTVLLHRVGPDAGGDGPRGRRGDGPGHDESSARVLGLPPSPAGEAAPRAAMPAGFALRFDAFVLRDLEKNGLVPAPPAGRLALLRRVHFDLLGLPPSPEEVERFAPRRPPRRLRDGSSTACWRRRTTASGGAATGSDVVRYAEPAGSSRIHVSERLAVPRLRHPLVRRRQAVRPLRPRAGRRRRAGRTTPRPSTATGCTASARCCRVGHDRGPVRIRVVDRRRRHDRRGLPRPDVRLCPLPRSQVRPDPPGRLLRDAGDLRRQRPALSRPRCARPDQGAQRVALGTPRCRRIC